MTTVFLSEDHHLVREGIKMLLQRDPTLALIGESGCGEETVQQVQKLKPDILLLDLMLPGLHGLEVLRQVGKKTKVIILTMHQDEPYVTEALRLGAFGYVLKDSTYKELLQAIKTASEGQHYLSPSLSQRALNQIVRQKRIPANGPYDPFENLTQRERLVLQLTAEGFNSAEIGKRLVISRRTAEVHRANLMRKLHLRSQTELVRFAIRKKVISV